MLSNSEGREDVRFGSLSEGWRERECPFSTPVLTFALAHAHGLMPISDNVLYLLFGIIITSLGLSEHDVIF